MLVVNLWLAWYLLCAKSYVNAKKRKQWHQERSSCRQNEIVSYRPCITLHLHSTQIDKCRSPYNISNNQDSFCWWNRDTDTGYPLLRLIRARTKQLSCILLRSFSANIALFTLVSSIAVFWDVTKCSPKKRLLTSEQHSFHKFCQSPILFYLQERFRSIFALWN